MAAQYHFGTESGMFAHQPNARRAAGAPRITLRTSQETDSIFLHSAAQLSENIYSPDLPWMMMMMMMNGWIDGWMAALTWLMLHVGTRDALKASVAARWISSS